jgi:uncharacterized membrane protein YhaH (DUF805 family)
MQTNSIWGNWKSVVVDNYANPTGRARRAEFWYFVLANLVIAIILGALSSLLGLPLIGNQPLLVSIYALAILIPNICVQIRRLHDSGKSGWWLLLLLTVIGAIVLIVFYVLDSEKAANTYGPSPKYPNG